MGIAAHRALTTSVLGLSNTMPSDTGVQTVQGALDVDTVLTRQQYELKPAAWRQLLRDLEEGGRLGPGDRQRLQKERRRIQYCNYTKKGRAKRISQAKKRKDDIERLREENASLRAELDRLKSSVAENL